MTDNKPTHEDELKACPFCGSRDIAVFHTQVWWASCETCHAEGQHWRTRRHAVRLWNTRKSEEYLEKCYQQALENANILCAELQGQLWDKGHKGEVS